MSRQAHTTTTHHRIKTILTVAVVAMVVSAGALAVVAVAPASAATTAIDSCDDDITSSGTYELVKPIGSSGTCLEITASDVTLDGEGNTIQGTGSGTGILVSEGLGRLTDVTVQNVKVTDFNDGITYQNVGNGVVLNSKASLNGQYGIEYQNVDIGRIAASDVLSSGATGIKLNSGSRLIDLEDNTISGSGYGISLQDSGYSHLTNNTASGNGLSGISLEDSGHSDLTNNTASGYFYDGINLGNSGHSDLTNNTASGNGRDGIYLYDSGSSDLTNNTASGNYHGIDLDDSDYSDLLNNTVDTNGDTGLVLFGVSGGSIKNNVLNNTDNIEIGGNIATNDWEYSNSSGPNVIGGPFLGGNYYAKPGSAEGFSEQCADSNRDGFCDSSKVLAGDNINEDNLPLTNVPDQQTGEPTIEIEPQRVEYGSVDVGETESRTLTVTNDGTAPLNVSETFLKETNNFPNASAFSIESGGAPFVVPAGGSEDVTVAFEPESAGEKKGLLKVKANNSGGPSPERAIALVGTGTAPADTNAPTVTGFDVSASGQNVDVAFDSDEQLADIEVSLGGDESGTLTEGDFTESQSGGTFTYTADVSDGQDGTFSATLETAADAAGNDGADGQSDSVTVSTPPDNQGPSAAFAAPSSATVGEQMSFDASGSGDSDGSIGSYEWDFGDGNSASGEQVTHTYGSAGEYDVTLTVTDDDGATDTASKTITVSEETPPPANDGPSASFTVDPNSPETGQSVSFDAAGSSDSDGSVRSYGWSFDDGDTAFGEQVTHTFDSAGDYTVELTVTDDDGATDTATRTISVTESGPDGNVLRIEGTGPAAQYDFSVTDDLTKSTANGANINQNDEVQRGYVGDGEVGTASDSYTFTGSLETIRILGGDANVYLNGQQLSAEELANMPNNVVEVEGTGPAASYDFAAVGTSGLQKVTANSSNLNGNDEVWRTTAYGRVGTARDAFGTDGALDSLDVDGDANVYLNGEAKDPATEEDHVITIVGTGPAASYEFRVGSGLSKSTANFANVNERTDDVSDNTATGEVGTASDSFVYTGDISAFSVDGDVQVYADGELVDQESVAERT